MKYVKNLLLVLMLLCGSACSFNKIDWIKMSDCALPCWNHIHVGKTTRDETIDTISKLPIIDPEAIYTTPFGSSFISEKTVFYTRTSGPFSYGDIRAYYSKNIVEELDFDGGIGSNINEIIQMVGEPEYVYTERTDVSGRISVLLISPSKGIDYGFVVSDPNAEFTDNTIPDYFEIFNPDEYDEMVKNNLFPYQNTSQLYKWQGYGNIKKLYWPSKQP